MNNVLLNKLFQEFSDLNLVAHSKHKLAEANEAYTVTTDSGKKYVIKILRTQSFASVNVESMIQDRLTAAGIKSPQYLRLKNGAILGDKDGVVFAISDHIVGETVTEIEHGLVFAFGKSLVLIHQALAGVAVPNNDAQWMCLDNVKRDLISYTGIEKNILSELLNQGADIFELGLPRAVIHGDLTLSNIFSRRNQVVAIFDFETVEDTPRILDIARTYLSLRKRCNFSAADVAVQLINGYNSIATFPLTAAEKAHFRLATVYVATACAVWCFNHGQSESAREYIALAGR